MMDQVQSYQQLQELLSEHKIDLSNWSHKQENKTLEQLWKEIKDGECYLNIVEKKLVRQLDVASMIVKFKLGDRYFQLVEDKQIFLTGKIRNRELVTITEKIKGGETPLQGAYRGLAEEVGLYIKEGLILGKESRWQKMSPSYPNLISMYRVFHYSIVLGQEELTKIRFSEYQPEEEMVNLYTLKPCSN